MAEFDQNPGRDHDRPSKAPISFEGLLNDEDRKKIDDMIGHHPTLLNPPFQAPTPESSHAGGPLMLPQPTSEPHDETTGTEPALEDPLASHDPDDSIEQKAPGESSSADPMHRLESELHNRIVQAEERSVTLSRDLEELIAERDELSSRLQTLEAEAEEAQQLAAQIEIENRSLTEQFQQQTDAFRADREVLQSERDGLLARIADQEQEYRELRDRQELDAQQLRALQQQFDETRAQSDELRQRLAESVQSSEKLQRQLESINQQAARQASQIEESRREASDLEGRLAESETLRQELEAQVESIDRKIAQRDRQIEQLQGELASSRDRIDTLTHQRDEHQGRLAELEPLLQARQEQIEQLQEDAARLEEELRRGTQRLHEEETERKRLTEEAHVARQAAEELNARYEQILETRRQQQDQLEQQAQLNRTLETTVASLTGERDEARQLAEETVENYAQRSTELDALQERLKAMATHLMRRKQRLKTVDGLLHQRTDTIVAERLKDGYETITDEKRKILNERQRILHRQEALTTTEQKMIRKWAPQKASLIVSSFVVMLAVLITASWFTTDHFFPAIHSASVTLAPKNREFAPLTEEQSDSWQRYHMELTRDKQFRETLVKRIADRQMAVDDEAVMAILDGQLSFDTGAPGELTLSMSGTDHKLVLELLDVLVSTMLVESTRSAEKRPDKSWAVASNERQDGGVSRYAVLNPTPVKDHRLMFLGPIFLVLSTLVGALFWMLYQQFMMAKRIIGSGNDVIDHNPSGDPQAIHQI